RGEENGCIRVVAHDFLDAERECVEVMGERGLRGHSSALLTRGWGMSMTRDRGRRWLTRCGIARLGAPSVSCDRAGCCAGVKGWYYGGASHVPPTFPPQEQGHGDQHQSRLPRRFGVRC